MQQFQKKRKLVDGFLSSNDALAEIRNKVRVEEVGSHSDSNKGTGS